MRLFGQICVSLLLFLSGLYSCKSTRNVSDFRERTDTQIRSEDSVVSHLQLQELDRVLMNEMVSEGWDVEFKLFLPPDSNGLQPLKMAGRAKQTKRVRHQEQRIHNKEETSTGKTGHRHDVAAHRDTEEKAENFKFSETNVLVRNVVHLLMVLLAFTLIYIFRKWLR